MGPQSRHNITYLQWYCVCWEITFSCFVPAALLFLFFKVNYWHHFSRPFISSIVRKLTSNSNSDLLYSYIEWTEHSFCQYCKISRIIVDKQITWRLHIETIETKAFTTLIIIYPLVKSERLSANIKLTLHKALVRSAMTYACLAWEFAAETHLLKLQRLQNRVLRTRIGSRYACGHWKLWKWKCSQYWGR
jgi:hypothetical protein